MQILDDELMHAIATSFIRIITQCNPQNMASTAWSFAKLEFCHAPLMASIASAALRMSSWKEEDEGEEAYPPQELANLAWAFATLGLPDGPLLAAISAQSLRPRAHFGP